MSIFSSISVKNPKKNAFSLSHERKMTTSFGLLAPILVEEVIPGDTFRVTSSILGRMMPTVAPIMHNVDIFTHFFYMPNRPLWKEWNDFYTGGDEHETDEYGNPILKNPEFPRLRINSQHPHFEAFTQLGGLADNMGLPVYQMRRIRDGYTDHEGVVHPPRNFTEDVSLLPFFAYFRIYNEWYRDQNLTKKLPDSLESRFYTFDDFDPSVWQLQYRAWKKDYFTSALPWAQKGEELSIPLSGNAPVSIAGSASGVPVWTQAGGGMPATPQDLRLVDSAPGLGAFIIVSGLTPGSSSQARMTVPLSASGQADLSQASAATINSLRYAFRLQRWLELNARAGTRINEFIKAHFGEDPGDARLQRPEFLGGGRQPMVISEVLQTSESGTTPQGNMSGHGVSASSIHGFSRTFKEPGYIIGIMSVVPRAEYFQGIHRHWHRFDRFDNYFPLFAHLGEQEIKNKELVFTGQERDEETFGYTPRYSDFRWRGDTVHGWFQDPLTLRPWTMLRELPEDVELSDDFVKIYDYNQHDFGIFPVQVSEGHDRLLFQIAHDIKALRKMPKYANPGGL